MGLNCSTLIHKYKYLLTTAISVHFLMFKYGYFFNQMLKTVFMVPLHWA